MNTQAKMRQIFPKGFSLSSWCRGSINTLEQYLGGGEGVVLEDVSLIVPLD